MKKLLAALSIMAMASSPAFAQGEAAGIGGLSVGATVGIAAAVVAVGVAVSNDDNNPGTPGTPGT